ncbi:helix-turn-helix domain-containing protein [Roseiconus lacunae]|uniref:Helix-turn-helix domain-containing protein n=1 Tax=Roseiconus lacunae TaxID=2605694 RepID=A0ABT7PCA6_9BACT|nr:helix-turn-helix domain-containing protein [Roseiconus lacunae]MCD0462455.1 helix-turn-helix domain-containing protein [Roseiconus lacunae]MDM4013891.1 helix-turn-helix domain-containing protein [Roseiconus lacunae]WRQ53197.1 helix-turn-helix domain-containing protein [Stieleria sp. HD01]
MKVLRKQDWFHSDGFPIVVERRDPQEPFGLHCHEFSEIVIITGGAGVHITGKDSYELKTGDTFVIGGDRPHDYLNMDRLSLINILFDPNELPLSIGDLQSLSGYHALFTLEPAWRSRHQFTSRLQLSPAELGETLHLVDKLDQELCARQPGFQVMAIAAMLELITFVSRCYGETHNPSSKSLIRVGETISHIRRDISQPIALEDLVNISGMSRTNYIRMFEAAMGTSPINYLIGLRIEEASRLLRSTDRSVTDIAFDVGFSDSNYFSRRFRKTQGQSPREYRKRYR